MEGRINEAIFNLRGFTIYFDELPKTSTGKIKRKEVLEKIVVGVLVLTGLGLIAIGYLHFGLKRRYLS